MCRSFEAANLQHFVINGDFLRVCAQSSKRRLSASLRASCYQRVADVFWGQDPSHLAPTKSLTGRSKKRRAANAPTFVSPRDSSQRCRHTAARIPFGVIFANCFHIGSSASQVCSNDAIAYPESGGSSVKASMSA